MVRLFSIALFLLVAAAAVSVLAQTTRPSSQPQSADDVLNRLLQPSRPAARPLQPEPDAPRTDTSTVTTVAPSSDQMNLIREGTYLVDRVGRLTKTPEGQEELSLEADGRGMKDPPLILLPNLKLQEMEKKLRVTSRDLRFRITGMITEYNGRNYILLDKVVIVPDQLTPGLRKPNSSNSSSAGQ